MGLPSNYGITNAAFAPASGLLGAGAMSAGVLINSTTPPASNSVVWGNNASSTGWSIRLQADASAPQTQLWNILTMGDTTAAGRTGATAPEILGFNAWTFICFTISGTTLNVYINGQLAATATVTALTAGPAVPVLTADPTQILGGAFYTEAALSAAQVQALAAGIMATGDIYSAGTLGTNLVTSLSLQHVYSALQGQRPISNTWEDVGTLANRPLTKTAGTTIPVVLPGLYL